MKKKLIDVWNASDVNIPNSLTIPYNLSENKYFDVCKQLNTGYLFDYQKVPQYDLIILFGSITISRYCDDIRIFVTRFRGIEFIANCFEIPTLFFDFGNVSNSLKEKWNTDIYKLVNPTDIEELFNFIKQINPENTLIVYGAFRQSTIEKYIYTDMTETIKKLIMEDE